MTKPLPDNVFYDINKLPADWGILFLPLSMSKLSNTQDPKSLIEGIRHFTNNKIRTPKLGANFAYGDLLYMHTGKPASELHRSNTPLMLNHQAGLKKIIKKNWQEFQIQEGFSFMSWAQLLLSAEIGSKDFINLFIELKEIYKSDARFQKLLAKDASEFGRELDENQINFFLEEHLLLMLVSYQKIKLPNNFIQGRENWVLTCYPGKPLRHEIYLHQLNPFKWTSSNPYKNAQYNLTDKKLYEFDRIDLDTYEL